MIIKNRFLLLTTTGSILICGLLNGCGQKNVESAAESESKYKKTYDLARITDETILSTSYAYDCYDKDYYPTVTRVESSELIVYGEIMAVENIVGESAIAWSITDFKILDTLKGEISKGDTIRVGECKGYVTPQDYIDRHEDEADKKKLRTEFSELTDEQLSTTFMEQTDGTPFPKVGDKAVYFLTQSCWTTPEEFVYEPVAGWYGKFTEYQEGEFAWISPDSAVSPRSRILTTETLQGERLQSFDELKSDIENLTN